MSMNPLKQSIVTEWSKVSQHFIDYIIGRWRRWHECVVQQHRGHVEHWM